MALAISRKQVVATVLVAGSFLGLASTSAIYADADATPQSTVASDSTTNKSSQTTTGKVTFTGGDLTLSGLEDPEPFSASVSDAYAGFSKETKMAPLTVLDNLGDGGNWTLTATAAGWIPESSDSSPIGASVLNNNGKLGISGVKVNGNDAKPAGTLVKGQSVEIAKGSAEDNGDNNVASGHYTFELQKGTNMRTGIYTNTITWTLSSQPENKN